MTPTPRLSRHILLLGLRASGKTTVAQALAARLGVFASDLDDRTRGRLGHASVREAFARAGEAAFRLAEAEALAEALAEEPPMVLALGGGTPTAPGADEAIERARAAGLAWTVFLDPPLGLLADRLSHDAGDRPSLTGLGVVDEIESIAAARRPRYAALADLVVASSEAPDAIASIICGSAAAAGVARPA
ncbi:MAG: Shikimate kinase 2 [Planctomycetota bacterium]